MKLLFDENLSPKQPGLLADLFPDSTHVRERGLLGRPDKEVWEYARSNEFTVVSKDSDFQQRTLLYGHPPKLIWLRIGNCTRQELVRLIKTYYKDIQDLDSNSAESILVLS